MVKKFIKKTDIKKEVSKNIQYKKDLNATEGDKSLSKSEAKIEEPEKTEEIKKGGHEKKQLESPTRLSVLEIKSEKISPKKNESPLTAFVPGRKEDKRKEETTKVEEKNKDAEKDKVEEKTNEEEKRKKENISEMKAKKIKLEVDDVGSKSDGSNEKETSEQQKTMIE